MLTTASSHATALRQALALKSFLVVGLCAAWCNTCAEFRAAFEELARSQTDAAFVWLDIEDDADVAGDIDVENFPTIGVFHQGRLLHFGVSLPQPALVARLLGSFSESSKTVPADLSVTDLPRKLALLAALRN